MRFGVRAAAALAGLLLLVTGCAGGEPNGEAGAAPGGGVDSATDGEADSAPALPTITVTPVLDDERAASALIGLDGGSLTAKGADGTVYTLEIPADSLRSPTTITMTPLISVEGTPWGDGPAYGVQLEPSGTVLDVYGRLSIEPAAPLPADEQILFDYRGDGAELSLAAPDPGGEGIVLLIQHFSGAGVKKGFLGNVDEARQRLGGSVEKQIYNEISATLQEDRAGAEHGEAGSWEVREKVEALFDRFDEEVLELRVKNASTGCAAAWLAMDTVRAILLYRALLGYEKEDYDLVSVFELGQVCIEEEYEMCTEQHIVHRMTDVWTLVERTAMVWGMDDDSSAMTQLARQRVRDCLNFELEFTSDSRIEVEAALITSSVSARVPLQFDPDAFDYDYVPQTLRNTAYQTTYADSTGVSGCSIVSTPGDGVFVPVKLRFDTKYEPGPDDTPGGIRTSMGEVTAVQLVWEDEPTQEITVMTCPDMYVPPYELTWSSAWAAGHHEQEYRPEPDGYWIEGWEVVGGEVWAKKEYSTATTLGVVTLEDTSSFILHHIPQKGG